MRRNTVAKPSRFILKVFGYSLIVLVILLFASRLSTEWERVVSYEIDLNYSWLIALLLFALSVLVSGLFWGQIINQISRLRRVKRIESLRGHLGAWIFRYIPGVGTASYKVLWGKNQNIRALDIFVAFTYENLFLQVASLGAGFFVVLSLIESSVIGANWPSVLIIGSLIVSFTFLMSNNILRRVITLLVSKRFKNQAVDIPFFGFWQSISYSGKFVLPRVINGLAVGLIAASFLGMMSIEEWLLIGAAYSIAVAVGILAVFAPSGIGVREATFVGILVIAGFDSLDVILISVAARLVATLSDLLIGGIFVALSAQGKKWV
jgi:hypothetical protein